MPPPPTATRVSGLLAKNKKHGWTLAETLITLTIIGIIAALTLPNLISSYRKAQIEAALPTAYNTLSTAIKLAQIQHGSVESMVASCNSCSPQDENCPGAAEKDQLSCFANNYLKPYLKYSKSCEKEEVRDNWDNKGHWTNKYCAATIYPVTNYKDIDGTQQNKSRLQPRYQQVLALNNGMLVGLIWGRAYAPTFVVDVNGTAGPNQSGADLFFFALYEYDQTDNIRRSKIANGLRCENYAYFSNEAQNKANWCKENDQLGTGCACLLQSNGWKFPKDYPIKKF